MSAPSRSATAPAAYMNRREVMIHLQVLHLHERSWDRPTGRRVARPRWRSALDEQTPCRRVPLSSPAVNCPPSGRRDDPEETREAVGAAPADRAITRTLNISRNTVRKWLPCAAG